MLGRSLAGQEGVVRGKLCAAWGGALTPLVKGGSRRTVGGMSIVWALARVDGAALNRMASAP
jgi:hypothetical protein